MRTFTAPRRARTALAALAVLAGLSLTAIPAGAAGGKTGDVVITGIAATEAPAAVALTRKVNEYEGQHRLGVAGGKDPELPTTPGRRFRGAD